MADDIINEPLTEEEMLALEKLYPREEEKQNIFAFFKKVIAMKDTTKTAFLVENVKTGERELGFARIPVRTHQELSLYAELMGNTWMQDAFFRESQITLATSLSREGFLDKLAVTQKREMDSKNRMVIPQENKGWFKSKSKTEEQGY